MSPKYFNLILFYIFSTSCIIIGSGLNVECVRSGDESEEDKSREKKGKNPSENTQNPADNLKQFHNGSSSSSANLKSMEKSTYTTAEIAFITALENACSALKIGDLLNAGSVCRALNEISERERSKRGLELAVLPSPYSSDVLNATSDFHVYNILSTKPSVAILFLSPKGEHRQPVYQDLDDRTIAVYRKFFPQHLVTVGVDASMMNKTIITSCPTYQTLPRGIVGLFIPIHENIQIKISSCSILREVHTSGCATSLINELRLDSNKEKSTIILLGNNINAITQVVNLIESNFIHKRYSLWGGLYDNKIIHSKTKDDINGERSMILALNLSGSHIKSWSTFLNLQTGQHGMIHATLSNFENRLKLQRYTIGLLCVPEFVVQRTPSGYVFLTSRHLMDSVKDFFPNIPFIGTFTSQTNHQIGVNSFSDGNTEVEESKMIGSIGINITNYRFLAVILMDTSVFCTACRIKANWLVASASCLLYVLANKVTGTVRFGSSFSDSGGDTLNITRIVLNPDLNTTRNRFANNIGLVEVAGSMDININSRSADFIDEKVSIQPGTILQIFGYGATLKPPGGIAQAAVVRVVQTSICTKSAKLKRLPRHIYCAASKFVAACFGDFGGPALFGRKLAGIISYSPDCGGAEAAGNSMMLTRVVSYLPWIEKTIR